MTVYYGQSILRVRRKTDIFRIIFNDILEYRNSVIIYAIIRILFDEYITKCC